MMRVNDMFNELFCIITGIIAGFLIGYTVAAYFHIRDLNRLRK